MTTTTPEHIQIKPSKLPFAGRGAFTLVELPKDHLLGEYIGEHISLETAQTRKENRYFMGVRKNHGVGDLLFLIDASSELNSSWLRYINTAFTKETSNVYPKTVGERVFYYTHCVVPAGSELLTYYGDEYVREIKRKVDILLLDKALR